MKSKIAAVLLVAGMSICGESRADVIVSTLSSWNGSMSESPWYSPNTTVYGQTVTVPTLESEIKSVTFELELQSGSINYQAYVYAWDAVNGHTTGPALYASSVQTLSAASGFQALTINANAAVTAGSQYVVFLYAETSTGAAQWGITNYGTGGFDYFNVGTNFGELSTNRWDCTGCGESAYSIDYSTVPEPTALALFGASLTALWFIRRRRTSLLAAA